jgi:phage host-nuclease inhibitor protein Gam
MFNVMVLEQTINNLLESYPELKDDEDLRKDMLEGSTKFNEVIESMLLKIQDSAALSKVAELKLRGIQERKSRFDKRVEFGRELIKKLMEIADVKKMEFATGTVSVTNKPPSVVILDESIIPDDFMKIKKEPNKTLIREMLEKMDVAGCTMSNGGTSLMIRQ